MSTIATNLARFFSRSADGKLRTLILPVDHGTAIPVPGLRDLSGLIGAANPWYNGYVLNYGGVRAAGAAVQGRGICFRTDVYKPAHDGNPNRGSYQVYGAAEAVRLGAHAVMNMLYVHHEEEDRIFAEAAALISECHAGGIPVILESLPFGIGRPADYTPENIGLAVRAAAELGADIVKTAYPGDKAAFADIVAAALVPVIVLGGAPTDDERAFLQDVRDAIDAGAVGIAIGRNVWAHPQPAKMARALHAIVHGGASVEAALAAAGSV
jgi:DhnA family fructose-bisphosphate aldolase class Ia